MEGRASAAHRDSLSSFSSDCEFSRWLTNQATLSAVNGRCAAPGCATGRKRTSGGFFFCPSFGWILGTSLFSLPSFGRKGAETAGIDANFEEQFAVVPMDDPGRMSLPPDATAAVREPSYR